MTSVSFRSPWNAARCMTSSESHQESSDFSRSFCEREANPGSHPSSSPANPSRAASLGFPPIAIRMTSGTPISVAAGSPFSPGAKVSQIASSAALAPGLSVIVTAVLLLARAIHLNYQSDSQRKGTAFRALHEGDPFVIPNPWDQGSARVPEALGFAVGVARG